MHQPIIILGAPRSGTSLLAELIEAHPDVAVIREPRLTWRYGNDRRSDQLRPEHASPEVIDHVHFSFGRFLEERGARRLVEKTPANSLRPLFVDAVFPDARYLHVTRNGWGAVPSLRQFWDRRSTGFDARQVEKLRRRIREARPAQFRHYVAELARRVPGPITSRPRLYGPRLAGMSAIVAELGKLETAALQWRTCVDAVTTFGRTLGPQRYFELRLEAFTTEAMVAALDFCCLPVVNAVLARHRDTYQPANATRMATLTAEERYLLAPYIVPTNAMLGYPYYNVPPATVDGQER